MHRPRRRPVALAAVLVAFTALAALAPPARADSSADEAEARFRRGAALYRERRYEEALLEFFASQRLVPNRNVVFNIARTYEALARWDEAYRYYYEYRHAEPDADARKVADGKLAEISPRVALLHVESQPPGSTVYVDRRDLGGRGETPLTLALPPGAHHVIVERAGHEPAETDVELARGKQVDTALTLAPIVGTVIVTAKPAGEVRVDRGDDDVAAPDATTTPATFRLPPGRHSFEVRAAGYRSRRQDVVVSAQSEAQLEIALELIPPPAGTVVVQASVRDALVVVDGQEQGFTPAVMNLVVGPHVVEVRMEGYEPWRREIDVTEGSRSFMQVNLREREPEVEGATRTAQRVSDAPASVSLVPGAEIHAVGYDVLADALRGVRGFYDSDDRNYRATGIRGFSRPGDYTNRVLVIRDGHVINDDWVGQGFVGRDFSVDLEDVERIEVVRGPGSTFYGPGAFFGVVNVVSLAPGEGPAVRAGAAATSDGGTRAFSRGSTRLAGGVGVSLSASAYSSEGRTLGFDEFADTASGGWVAGADGEDAEQIALRARSGGFSLDARWNRREKQIPTASYETVFDPARYEPTGGVVTGTVDERTFAEARFEPALGSGRRLILRAWYDRAEYDGRWPYADDESTPEDDSFLFLDTATSQWFGAEARGATDLPGGQRLTVGGEVAYHDVTQSYDDGSEEWIDPHTFVTASAYAVDEVRLGARARLTAGVRLDQSGAQEKFSISPRVAAVFSPYEAGRTKLIFGRAFRAPTVYELYYWDNGVTQVQAPDLEPETVWTGEVEHTHAVGDRSYVTASLFGSRISSLINLGETDEGLLQYQNSTDDVLAVGGELEGRRTWRSGAYVMSAVSLTTLRTDDDTARTNSTPVVAMARGFWPALRADTGLSAEVIYNGRRRDRMGDYSEHMLLANLIASGRLGDTRVRFRVGVYNLLDWRYSVPVGEEYLPVRIEQQGRTFLTQLSYDY